jgi:hypothetical protein
MIPRAVMFVITSRPGNLVRIVLELSRPEMSPADLLIDATSNVGSASSTTVCAAGVPQPIVAKVHASAARRRVMLTYC